jgi:hypothetical protein
MVSASKRAARPKPKLKIAVVWKPPFRAALPIGVTRLKTTVEAIARSQPSQREELRAIWFIVKKGGNCEF